MKSEQAFRTISEVAGDLNVPQHVLRFWESRFSQLKPLKRGGNRRYYRPEDIALLKAIHEHLYAKGYTIKGVQRLLKDHGPRGIIDAAVAVSVSAVGPAPSSGAGAGDTLERRKVEAALRELKAMRALLD